MNTVNINGLYVLPSCLGENMLLNRVSPYYLYENNARTNTILGYKYTVVLPSKGFQSLDVKIESREPLVRIPAGTAWVPVQFDGLEVKLYYDRTNRVQLSAKAAGVELVTGQAEAV